MSDPRPTAAEIRQWLQTQFVEQAETWAGYLEGLPWGYIKPVVKIAINAHHEHPALVLATAAKASDDILFKLTAKNHIAANGGTS